MMDAAKRCELILPKERVDAELRSGMQKFDIDERARGHALVCEEVLRAFKTSLNQNAGGTPDGSNANIPLPAIRNSVDTECSPHRQCSPEEFVEVLATLVSAVGHKSRLDQVRVCNIFQLIGPASRSIGPISLTPNA